MGAHLLDACDLGLHEEVVRARLPRRPVGILLALAPAPAPAPASAPTIDKPADARVATGAHLHMVWHATAARAHLPRHAGHAGWVLHHRVRARHRDLELATWPRALRDDDHVLLAGRCHDNHLLAGAHIGRHVDEHKGHLWRSLLLLLLHLWHLLGEARLLLRREPLLLLLRCELLLLERVLLHVGHAGHAVRVLSRHAVAPLHPLGHSLVR